jgi:hypothetical protein
MGEIYKHDNGSFEVTSAVCPKCGGGDWYGTGSLAPKILCKKCDIKMKIKVKNNGLNMRGAGVTVWLLVVFAGVVGVVVFLFSL